MGKEKELMLKDVPIPIPVVVMLSLLLLLVAVGVVPAMMPWNGSVRAEEERRDSWVII